IGVSYGPVSENAAAAAASDTQLLSVDITTLDEFVDAGHQVEIVVAGIAILNDVAKILSVASRAARVRIEHDVSLGGHPMKLVIEDPSVGGVRSAVNVENQRILLLGIEVGRFLYPGLDLLAVETGVVNFLGSGDVQLRPQVVIRVGQALLASV